MIRNKHQASAKKTWLKNLPALRRCSDHELDEISGLLDECEVTAGTTLTKQGAPARQAFVIVEGSAAVFVDGAQVAQLGPGEFIGEMAMLDHGLRSATVVAETPMRLFVVGPAAFGDFVNRPSVASGIARELASRLRRADTALTR